MLVSLTLVVCVGGGWVVETPEVLFPREGLRNSKCARRRAAVPSQLPGWELSLLPHVALVAGELRQPYLEVPCGVFTKCTVLLSSSF